MKVQDRCRVPPLPAFPGGDTPARQPGAPAGPPAPALPPTGLDSAIPTSGTSGDCLINCGIFVGEWVYNVTYVQCCGQTHTCSDGSTGYGWVFYPPVGVGQRCANCAIFNLRAGRGATGRPWPVPPV
jgi:hypothetical protein